MGPKNHAYANMAGNQSNFSIGNSTEQGRNLRLCFRGVGGVKLMFVRRWRG